MTLDPRWSPSSNVYSLGDQPPASPEVYDLVVNRVGRTPAEFEYWLSTTLMAAPHTS